MKIYLTFKRYQGKIKETTNKFIQKIFNIRIINEIPNLMCRN